MAKYCPDCSTVLGGHDNCRQCGWSERKQSASKKIDHRCDFSNSSGRCPMTGTRSADLRGKGPWLCSMHFQAQGDPVLSAKILDEFKTCAQRTLPDGHGHRVEPVHRDWRDVLVDQSAMKLGVMDQTAKIDTLEFMRETVRAVIRNS